MSEEKRSAPVNLGIFGRKRQQDGFAAADVIALSLSLLWLVASAIFFAVARIGGKEIGFDPLTFVLTFLAITMPVALIWVGASAAKSAKIMREESSRLQAAIDAMRQTYIQQQHAVSTGTQPSVEKRLNEIAAAAKQTENTLATFATSRPRTNHPKPEPKTVDDDQPLLALGTTAEDMRPPLSIQDFIRALNFPETADDKEGFHALRLALEDHNASKLVRSAQDVLTLLSQDGIYMDDLRPDRARPEIWRRFANGERGPAIAGLGGVRDRSCLALTAGRMRQDPVFRDTMHHFIRQFDHTLTGFEKEASDQDLSDLAETRTARAFMLLGRVSGTFD